MSNNGNLNVQVKEICPACGANVIAPRIHHSVRMECNCMFNVRFDDCFQLFTTVGDFHFVIGVQCHTPYRLSLTLYDNEQCNRSVYRNAIYLIQHESQMVSDQWFTERYTRMALQWTPLLTQCPLSVAEHQIAFDCILPNCGDSIGRIRWNRSSDTIHLRNK